MADTWHTITCYKIIVGALVFKYYYSTPDLKLRVIVT